MLQEIASTHRINNHKPKRWFTDADMDLFIWFKNKRPVCFQFSYNKRQQEHALSWHVDAGFSHSLLKTEQRHTKYQTPTSASSESKQNFNHFSVAREFLQASEQIENSLADFIFARLLEYADQLDKHSDQALVSKSL